MPRSTTPARPGPPSLRRGIAAIASAVLLISVVAACTGGDDEAEPPDPSPSTPVPEPVVALVAEVTDVAGTLNRAARSKVEAQIAKSLQEYADAAFLGDYPRTDFGTAFASFTPGAAKTARQDLDLLTGQPFAQAESVAATKLSAKASVLAPRGRVAGATVRVRFDLEVDGTPVTVSGRVLLTPDRRGWRIFGYDLSSDAVDALTAVAATGGDS